MDPFLASIMETHTPKPNPEIMRGLACTYMAHAEQYIDTVFKSVSRGFPKGLEYCGYARCTPQEEFDEITRAKNNKRTFDLAINSLYLVKYYFKFNGVDLPPRFLFLPYLEPGGLIRLGGSLFHMSPVLADKVISPQMNSIFVRLLRDRVNFDRCYHSLVIDGVSESEQIVWSRLHRRPQSAAKVPDTTRAKTSIVHYLLGQFGYTEMFRRYCGFVPIIGEGEITTEKYPSDQYVICESAKYKPKTYIDAFYKPTNIKIAVPKDRWNNHVRSMIAGFFYTVDHFPTRMRAEWVDNVDLWKVLLGHIIWSGNYGEGKLFANALEHYASLDQYADSIIVEKLKQLNYHIETFYDLLNLLVKHFNQWIVEGTENSTSLFGKSVEVLYYALYDITSSIFRTNFRLNKLATRKVLLPKEITETFNKYLKPGAIFGLTRSNIVMSSVSYSGDNMYPKITSVVAQQQSNSGATRGRRARTVVDSSKRADASMLEVGSILFLSKSDPSPARRMNMFANIDLATGTILPKDQFAELRREVTQSLKNPPTIG